MRGVQFCYSTYKVFRIRLKVETIPGYPARCIISTSNFCIPPSHIRLSHCYFQLFLSQLSLPVNKTDQKIVERPLSWESPGSCKPREAYNPPIADINHDKCWSDNVPRVLRRAVFKQNCLCLVIVSDLASFVYNRIVTGILLGILVGGHGFYF